METQCESCMHLQYDAEYEEYSCMISLDEDEHSRFQGDISYRCPYYRLGDDYTIVRKQG